MLADTDESATELWQLHPAVWIEEPPMPVGSDETMGANSKTPITRVRAVIALLKFPFPILTTSAVNVDQSNHVRMIVSTVLCA